MVNLHLTFNYAISYSTSYRIKEHSLFSNCTIKTSPVVVDHEAKVNSGTMKAAYQCGGSKPIFIPAVSIASSILHVHHIKSFVYVRIKSLLLSNQLFKWNTRGYALILDGILYTFYLNWSLLFIDFLVSPGFHVVFD
jgi:hypothetical protein